MAPLTDKGKTIMGAMTRPKAEGGYGEEKGKRVFYASRNKGTITGVDPESTAKAKCPHCGADGAMPPDGEPKCSKCGKNFQHKGAENDKLVREHRRLVKVLKSPSRKDDAEEAKKQGKKLREYEGRSATMAKAVLFTRAPGWLTALIVKAEQLSLFAAPRGEVQTPGSRGGTFHRSKKSGKVRYGANVRNVRAAHAAGEFADWSADDHKAAASEHETRAQKALEHARATGDNPDDRKTHSDSLVAAMAHRDLAGEKGGDGEPQEGRIRYSSKDLAYQGVTRSGRSVLRPKGPLRPEHPEAANALMRDQADALKHARESRWTDADHEDAAKIHSRRAKELNQQPLGDEDWQARSHIAAHHAALSRFHLQQAKNPR